MLNIFGCNCMYVMKVTWITRVYDSRCLKNPRKNQVFKYDTLALVECLSERMLYDTRGCMERVTRTPKSVYALSTTSCNKLPNLKIKLSVKNDSYMRLNIHYIMHF